MSKSNHIIIGLFPCARNFVIKTELFHSKTMWQRLLLASFCANKILKILYFQMTRRICWFPRNVGFWLPPVICQKFCYFEQIVKFKL